MPVQQSWSFQAKLGRNSAKLCAGVWVAKTLGLGFKANAYLWSEMFWWFPSSTAMRIGQSKISNKHDSNYVSKPRGRAYITWGVVRDVLNQCLTLHTSKSMAERCIATSKAYKSRVHNDKKQARPLAAQFLFTSTHTKPEQVGKVSTRPCTGSSLDTTDSCT